jgi:hypothetical protein
LGAKHSFFDFMNFVYFLSKNKFTTAHCNNKE